MSPHGQGVGPISVPLVVARRRRGAVLAVAVLILAVSVAPAPADPTTPFGPWLDEAIHLVAYATLALSLAYATVEWESVPGRRVAFVVCVVVAYGISIEFVQTPLSTRQFSTTDVLADVTGALVGIAWVGLEHWVEYRPVGVGGSSTARREE